MAETYEPVSEGSETPCTEATKASAITCEVCAICHGLAPSSARATPIESASIVAGGAHATRRSRSGVRTFSTGIRASTGTSTGVAYTVAAAQILIALLTYSTLRTTPAWVLTSVTVSA